MFLVPLSRPRYGFFDRQRQLFPSWHQLLYDDWQDIDHAVSIRRFDDELDQLRQQMYQLRRAADSAAVRQLQVQNPFVTDPEGNKKFSLRFDCSEFKPEEVEVKMQDDSLSVHAKHEEEKDGKKVYREFHRMYTLPEVVDAKQLKATLAQDGVLAIEGPMPQSIEAPKERTIPIEKLDQKPDEQVAQQTDKQTN